MEGGRFLRRIREQVAQEHAPPALPFSWSDGNGRRPSKRGREIEGGEAMTTIGFSGSTPAPGKAIGFCWR